MERKGFWKVCLVAISIFLLICGNLKAAEKKVLFQEDFNILNRDNWEIGNPENFLIKDGVMSLVPGGCNQYWIASYDLFKYGELEIKVRFPLAFRDGALYSFGFSSRKPWGKNCVMVATSSKTGDLSFCIGKENGAPGINQTAGKLLQNTWHILKFVWQPDRAEFFLDGKSCGYTENKGCIPDAELPIVLDTFASSGGNVSFDIDYVKVIGTE